MDLKDWQKISEDEHSVTMKHGKGHTMTIAVKALPRIQQEAIRRLKFADGGGVSEQGKDIRYGHKMKRLGDPDKAEMSKDMAKEEAKGRAAEERHVKPNLKGLSKGGEIKHSQYFADQGLVDSDKSDQQSDDQSQPGHTTIINVGQQSPAQDAQPQQPTPVPDYSQASVPPQPVQPTPQGTGIQQEAQKTINTADLNNRAADLGQTADTNVAQGIAKASAERLAQEQDYLKNVQGHIQDMAQHTEDFANHLKKVDPDHYWNNKGTASKISTGLGLFLGGLSTPFGGHNYAQDFLNKQIQNDMQAQKENNENRKTIWDAYNDLYHNENVADALTKVSLNDMVKQKADLITAQNGGINAAKNNALLKAELNQKNADLRLKAAGFAGGQYKSPSVKNSPQSTPSHQMGKLPAKSQASYISPTDKSWGDEWLKPGSSQPPKSGEIPQVSIDMAKFKNSTMLGAQGVPGEILPGEVNDANRAIDEANSTNQAIKEIHKQFGEMWKNGADADSFYKQLKGQSLFGIHAPDFTHSSPEIKRYYTAAASIKKVLANAVKGGGSQELYDLIEDQLPRQNDTASDFRQKLENVDKILRQPLSVSVLKKYGIAKGLPE